MIIRLCVVVVYIDYEKKTEKSVVISGEALAIIQTLHANTVAVNGLPIVIKS